MIQMDPPIQGAKMLVSGARSSRIHRFRGQKYLSGVQDPDGSTDPGGKNICEWCRIQMDPPIQEAKMLVRGAGSRWIHRSRGQKCPPLEAGKSENVKEKYGPKKSES
jgi:hypothetical protein